ncbi:MAG TPA: hypothetical protein VHN79_14595 [Lacunisphaera sp.]|nr:hypothetical protein [Lacunisphaera sp.]
MPILRLLLAGLVALAAMAAVAFTAVVVLVTGLVGWVAQTLRGKSGPARTVPTPNRRATTSMRSDEVIDVVATNVPDDKGVRPTQP